LITSDCDSTVNDFTCFQLNPKYFFKVVLIRRRWHWVLFINTDIKIQPVNLNNGDNNKTCCSAFWVPTIKTHSWLPSCIAVWMNYYLYCLNFLSLMAYSDCHHCWDSYTDSYWFIHHCWDAYTDTKSFFKVHTDYLKERFCFIRTTF